MRDEVFRTRGNAAILDLHPNYLQIIGKRNYLSFILDRLFNSETRHTGFRRYFRSSLRVSNLSSRVERVQSTATGCNYESIALKSGSKPAAASAQRTTLATKPDLAHGHS